MGASMGAPMAAPTATAMATPLVPHAMGGLSGNVQGGMFDSIQLGSIVDGTDGGGGKGKQWACVECHKAKTACEGYPCRRCQRLGKTCVLPDRPMRRRRGDPIGAGCAPHSGAPNSGASSATASNAACDPLHPIPRFSTGPLVDADSTSIGDAQPALQPSTHAVPIASAPSAPSDSPSLAPSLAAALAPSAADFPSLLLRSGGPAQIAMLAARVDRLLFPGWVVPRHGSQP